MIITMKIDPIPHCRTYNQDDATGFILVEYLALEGGGEGAEEEINRN